MQSCLFPSEGFSLVCLGRFLVQKFQVDVNLLISLRITVVLGNLQGNFSPTVASRTALTVPTEKHDVQQYNEPYMHTTITIT
jgi:hypothetical protein